MQTVKNICFTRNTHQFRRNGLDVEMLLKFGNVHHHHHQYSALGLDLNRIGSDRIETDQLKYLASKSRNGWKTFNKWCNTTHAHIHTRASTNTHIYKQMCIVRDSHFIHCLSLNIEHFDYTSIQSGNSRADEMNWLRKSEKVKYYRNERERKRMKYKRVLDETALLYISLLA